VTAGPGAEANAAAAALRRLHQTLGVIARTDPSRETTTDPAGPDSPDTAARYTRRNTLILSALALARQAGLDAGVGHDPDDPHPVVVYLELPGTGQVSWHLPTHPAPWDGHTTGEKYTRIAAFLHRSL